MEFGKSERGVRDSLRDIEALQSSLLTAHFLHIFSDCTQPLYALLSPCSVSRYLDLTEVVRE